MFSFVYCHTLPFCSLEGLPEHVSIEHFTVAYEYSNGVNQIFLKFMLSLVLPLINMNCLIGSRKKIIGFQIISGSTELITRSECCRLFVIPFNEKF